MILIESDVNKAFVYADKLDSGAEGFLRALCASPMSEGSSIRVMPDAHAGKGCVVGLTMTLGKKAPPGIVGTDIGCGITAMRFTARKFELQKLDKLTHNLIPSGSAVRQIPHRFADEADLSGLVCARHVRLEKARRAVGSLGGGNHFIEVDRGEDGSYWLIIHSGSRSLGAEIAGHYQEAAFRDTPEGVPFEFAYATGALLEDYLHDLRIAQQFAEINRRAIADEIVRGMKLRVAETFSCIHNYVDTDRMILRKGAISAQAGERLIVPLNMRDGCLIGRGKGNPEWNESAPHGAGRLLSRADARQSFTLSQFKKEMKNVYSTTVSRGTLDESPMAYKPPQAILDKIAPTMEITERLTPIYNFKAETE